MLDESDALVLVASKAEALVPRAPHPGVDDQSAGADRADPLDHGKEVVGIQVIEDAEGEHEIELAVPFAVEVADVAELEVDIEVECSRSEARLLDVRLPPFDCNDLGAALRELERVHAFEGCEIEHPNVCKRASEHVDGELRDAAELDLVARRLRRDRVETVGEADVVRRPRPVARLDRLLPP